MTDGINGAWVDTTRDAFRSRTTDSRGRTRIGTWYPVSYGGWQFVEDKKRKTKKRKSNG